jgi:DNA polymerase-3 subunit epsilon
MELNLKKPIVFFDIESTGTNVAADRICEICFLKISPDGKQEMKTRRINPTIPIPAEVSLIHGIYDEDVKDEPTFKSLAKGIMDFIGEADLAGYNSNKFDIPLLAEELLRAGSDFDLSQCRSIDVQNIFHKKEQRTLVAALKFYCESDLVNAHSAEADVRATYEVLKAQLLRYEDLPREVAALSDFSTMNKAADFAGFITYDSEGQEQFSFGKYKGQRVSHVLSKDSGYYSWLQNADFPLFTKKILTAIRLRMR